MAPIDWHPRRLARPSEWTLFVPGQVEPIAVVRTITVRGQLTFRAATWAQRSDQRELIGKFFDGDTAAEACWERYITARRARHEIAARTHGSDERGPQRKRKPPEQ